MTAEKYLLVKGRAGLGNRLQAVLTGILYARLSGRRLLIDWRDHDYSSDGQNVFPRLFSCADYDPGLAIPETESVVPAIWRTNLNESVSDVHQRLLLRNQWNSWLRSSIDPARTDFDEAVAVFWCFSQQIRRFQPALTERFPALAGLSQEDLLRGLMQNDLKLQPEVAERVDRFKREQLTQPTIGVHVRYTDYQTNLFAILSRLDWLIARIPTAQVFLATDNLQIKKLFEATYSRVTSTEHWYPEPGRRLHGNSECPDLLENAIEALVDMYLMADCDWLILDSSSSFSYIVKLLSRAPTDRVFDMRARRKLRAPLRTLLWRTAFRINWFTWGLDLVRWTRQVRRKIAG